MHSLFNSVTSLPVLLFILEINETLCTDTVMGAFWEALEKTSTVKEYIKIFSDILQKMFTVNIIKLYSNV